MIVMNYIQILKKILKLIKILPKDWDIFLIGYWLHKVNDGRKNK